MNRAFIINIVDNRSNQYRKITAENLRMMVLGCVEGSNKLEVAVHEVKELTPEEKLQAEIARAAQEADWANFDNQT